jgi:hypothetical protein
VSFSLKDNADQFSNWFLNRVPDGGHCIGALLDNSW